MVQLKILHVIQSMDSRHGGPVSVLRGLMRAQALTGHRVTVCTTASEQRLLQIDNKKGYAFSVIEDLVTCYRAAAFTPMLFSPSLFRWLQREIRQFDVVHIHGLYRFPPTYAAWCARKAGVPYIISPHGALDPFLYRQSRYGRKALLLKRLYERLFDFPNLNCAAAIHYTAREEAERAAFLGLEVPAIVVPNGIEWKEYAELPARGVFRRRLGLEVDRPLVLFLGRINFKKGLDLLVPAFANVARIFPEARLAVVGPDNEGYGRKVREWCRDHGVQDKVMFVDHLDSARVREAYVDADVFVLPSYTENFGMTVVEAMACCCPVVISDQVHIHADVAQAEAGLVTRCESGEVAAAIKTLLRVPERRRRMGEAGRRLVLERYSWSAIVDALTREYEAVIERCRTSRQIAGGRV